MSVRRTLPASVFTLFLVPLLVLFVDGCKPVQFWNRLRADRLIKEAQEKLLKAKFKENVQLLREAANIDPTNPRVWGGLCSGYQNIEEFDLAIDACKRQIAIHPDGLDYNSLGLAYMEKKDYPNAITAFEAAVKYSPDFAMYGNLVSALQSAKQYDKAIQEAERGVDVFGQSPVALAQALEILIGALQSTQQYDRAIPAAERLVEASSRVPALLGHALRTLIFAQVNAQHYDRAIGPAQQLVEVSAGNSTDLNTALEILGAIYMKLGQTTKAQEAFAKVPKPNPRQSITTCEIKNDEFTVTCRYSH